MPSKASRGEKYRSRRFRKKPREGAASFVSLIVRASGVAHLAPGPAPVQSWPLTDERLDRGGHRGPPPHRAFQGRRQDLPRAVGRHLPVGRLEQEPVEGFAVTEDRKSTRLNSS